MQKILVVVDMQNDFITGSLGTPEAQAIAPKVANFLAANKDSYDRVIFTRDCHNDNYLETCEGKKLPIPHCIEGTEGYEILNSLTSLFESRLEYSIIRKETFGSTLLPSEIEWWIERYGGDIEIDFCGVCTDICVISNVLLIKAYFPEANITVYKDLCAGVSPYFHDAALEVMNSCHINII